MRIERVDRSGCSRRVPGWQLGMELHAPRADGSTRLISRNRFRLPSLTAKIAMLPMEPGSLLMEQKMLRGIKQRAEHLAFQ